MFTRYTRGMVYWADLPNVIQNVQFGKRPVIIISNNVSNLYSKLVTIVPCTTNINKNHQPTHTIVNLGTEEDSLVLCEMILTINKNLLGRFMGILDDDSMQAINKCLAIQIGLENIEVNKLKPIETPISIPNKNNTELKKPVGIYITDDDEMRRFIELADNRKIDELMKKYNIPTRAAALQRASYYKRKLRSKEKRKNEYKKNN